MNRILTVEQLTVGYSKAPIVRNLALHVDEARGLQRHLHHAAALGPKLVESQPLAVRRYGRVVGPNRPGRCLAHLAGAGLGARGAVARLAVEPGGVTLYALARRSATYPVLGAALALVAWAVVLRVRRGSEDVDLVDVE